MPTQIDTSTADSQTTGDITATGAAAQLVVIPSDASLAALYYGTNGPTLATAQSPYTTWSTQSIGTPSPRNSQAVIGHTGDDNLQAVVTSASLGPYYFTFTRSGNTWSQNAVGQTGDANNAAIGGTAAAMWSGRDPQGRYWYIGVDDVNATYVLACGHYNGTSWTLDATIDGLALGEQNHRGMAAAFVGNYLVVVYDSGSGALSYRRLDVSQATLGSWSAAAAITGVSGVSTASTLSFRAIPGGSTAMLAYTASGGIQALSYNATADTWGSVTTLSSAANDRHPCLIPGASGVVYAVWCQYASANTYVLVGEAYSSGAWSGSVTTLETSANAGTNAAWPNGAYLTTGTKLALIWTTATASPWAVQFDSVAAPATGGGSTVNGSGTLVANSALSLSVAQVTMPSAPVISNSVLSAPSAQIQVVSAPVVANSLITVTAAQIVLTSAVMQANSALVLTQGAMLGTVTIADSAVATVTIADS